MVSLEIDRILQTTTPAGIPKVYSTSIRLHSGIAKHNNQNAEVSLLSGRWESTGLRVL